MNFKIKKVWVKFKKYLMHEVLRNTKWVHFYTVGASIV